MGVATLGGVSFRIDPDAVAWQFNMKVSQTRTLGGKVVQIIGTEQTSMTVAGDFGHGNYAYGDTQGWEQQRRFLERIKGWVQDAETSKNPTPLVFSYPPRNWHMQVYIQTVASKEGQIEHNNVNLNPSYLLTLFVLSDLSRVVVKGIRDLYIKRLASGIGWKQSQYNGPSQDQLDNMLHGRSVQQYLDDEANKAFNGGGG